MKHFVLVHGAWLYSECWLPLKSILQNHGQVYTPYLIPKKSYQNIHLSDYVNQLKKIIESIQEPVILVAHSFAGFPATEVANSIPHQIEELVYLNAFIPMQNETLFSLSADFCYQHLNPFLKIDNHLKTIRLEPQKEASRWLCSNKLNLRPEPLLPFSQCLSTFQSLIYPRRALIGQQDLCISAEDQIKMCERQNINYQLFNADHCPFQSAAHQLRQMIIKEKPCSNLS